MPLWEHYFNFLSSDLCCCAEDKLSEACALHHVNFMMMEVAIKITAKLFGWFVCVTSLLALCLSMFHFPS